MKLTLLNKVLLQNPKQAKSARLSFVIFCAYYILATYLIPSSGVIIKYSASYYFLAIPGWIYIVFNYRYLFFRGYFVVKLWWIFIALALFVSLARNDIPFAYNSLYLGLLAITIINSGGFLRTVEINILFIATIFGSILFYTFGLTDYGFLPFDASGVEGCHKSLQYRVSLFSAAFSFFVLLWNVFRPPLRISWFRWTCIFLSIYFIIFSGIRSAFFALLVVLPFMTFHLLPDLKGVLRAVISFIAPFIFIGVLIFQFSLFSTGGAKDFFMQFLLRTNSCAAITVLTESQPQALMANNVFSNTINEISQFTPYVGQLISSQANFSSWLDHTINRHCSARYQLRLFFEHPFFGNSVVHPESLEDRAKVGCSPEAIQFFCDACVLSTYWLSKGGVAGVMLIVIYCATLTLVMYRKSLFGLVVLISFGLILQGWGVMFVPYNFVFYMLMSLMALLKFHELPIKKEVKN